MAHVKYHVFLYPLTGINVIIVIMLQIVPMIFSVWHAGPHAAVGVLVTTSTACVQLRIAPRDGQALTAELVRHYSDVIMGAMAFQITSLTIFFSTVYSGADQRKHQSSASLAFVRGIHRWPVNSPRKRPVTRKMVPFDDGISLCMQTAAKGLRWSWNLFYVRT